MENKDFLLTLVVLGGLALGGYYLLQRSQGQQPAPMPTPSPEPGPPPSGSDVVPSPFGYSVGDPCKRFPSLCKF